MDYNPLLFTGLQVAIAAYAIWKGGSPERRAAIMQVCAYLASFASYRLADAHFYHLEAGFFLIDLALLAGLYWLALRSNRLWPMLMAALQLSSILVHVARVVDVGMSAWAYAFLLKIWGYPMVLLLGAAVYRHRRRVSKFGIDRAWSL